MCLNDQKQGTVISEIFLSSPLHSKIRHYLFSCMLHLCEVPGCNALNNAGQQCLAQHQTERSYAQGCLRAALAQKICASAYYNFWSVSLDVNQTRSTRPPRRVMLLGLLALPPSLPSIPLSHCSQQQLITYIHTGSSGHSSGRNTCWKEWLGIKSRTL